MNSIEVSDKELSAVQAMLEQVAPEVADLLRHARTNGIKDSGSGSREPTTELKCTDQFLEVVWSALKDNLAQLPPETSYNNLPACDLVECVEAWMIAWSASNEDEKLPMSA
jgi:hypothetical protein